jgi:hypothetical protein
VDLAVAVRARDPAATRVLAERLRSRFEPGAAPGSPFRQLAERAGAPADELTPLVSAGADRLADSLGRDYLELGAWAEASRLAAHGRDEAFFRAGHAVPRDAGRLVAEDAEAARALERVRAALAAEGPPRWDALEPALDALLAELAGG